MVNVAKLTNELVNAGIPIHGCASDGRIDFKDEATEAQRQAALAILAAHVPEDYRDKREVAYAQQGVTVEAMIGALWERVMDGRPETSDALQAIRERIKEQFPAPR